MRIQNNITAMNTHRQYTINNDNVAKAAEKLSSGYRINRAGDDAAGLAISEKMRSQIRGLNMATKNSQDAISLVQTAEGALQETQNMLQRMNELAVQAATGTNQEIDRNALAKEFEQLKREINDVAEQTTFNNMKVLDGSLSYVGPERSASTAGINVTKPTPSETASPADAINVNTTKAVAATADFTTGTFGVAKSGSLSGTATGGSGTSGAMAAGDQLTLEVEVAGGKKGSVTITLDATDAGNATSGNGVGQLFTGEKFTIDGQEYTVGWDGGSNNITITQSGAQVTAEAQLAAGTTPKMTIKMADGTASGFTVADGSTTTAAVDGEGTPETKASVIITAQDVSKIKAGDKLTVGDKTVTFDENNLPADIDALATLIGTPTGTTVAKNGDSITITSTKTGTTVTDGDADVVAKFESAAAAAASTGSYTMEFDTVKMRDGDKFSFALADGTTTDVAYEAGMTANEFAAAVADALGLDATAVKGNALVVDQEISATLDKANWGTATKEPNAMMIQVGALENEQLAISIDSMNTAGLKLDGTNLESQGNAGSAITAVRAAINKVSDQRATLGAMQNRLDHKIANLKVSTENLSAAESRIRDVDMASEMTNFTKNNILSQAATAMLAQANALPQNVLSLLG